MFMAIGCTTGLMTGPAYLFAALEYASQALRAFPLPSEESIRSERKSGDTRPPSPEKRDYTRPSSTLRNRTEHGATQSSLLPQVLKCESELGQDD